MGRKSLVAFTAAYALSIIPMIAASPQILPPTKKNKITYYDMPTVEAGPCDLSTGPDGAVWVSDFLSPKVARIDPVSGNITEFEIPYKTAPVVDVDLPGPLAKLANRAALGCVSQPGNDGRMYFASGLRNEFAVMNIRTKKIKTFQFENPLGNLEPLNDMWRGPKGTGMFITQTTANKISMFDYKTEKIKDWTVPTPNSGPVGLYLASDGLMWFCEFLANKMGSLNITSGEIKEYDVPKPLIGPAVTRAETKDSKGNHFVWFTGFIGNKMGAINIKTGAIKLYDLPQPLSFPVEDTVDSLGNIWYSVATYNTVNRLNPNTGKVTVFEQEGSVVPQPGFPPSANIAVHYGPGDDIWFTELAKNRVGRLHLKGQKGRDVCCGPEYNDRFKHLKGFDFYGPDSP